MITKKNKPVKSVASKSPMDSIATQKGGSPKSTKGGMSKKNC
jgi:hypothetical protein